MSAFFYFILSTIVNQNVSFHLPLNLQETAKVLIFRFAKANWITGQPSRLKGSVGKNRWTYVWIIHYMSSRVSKRFAKKFENFSSYYANFFAKRNGAKNAKTKENFANIFSHFAKISAKTYGVVTINWAKKSFLHCIFREIFAFFISRKVCIFSRNDFPFSLETLI